LKPSIDASRMVDAATRSTVQKIPLLKTRAGPLDGGDWTQRLKEEYRGLIKYIQINKDNDNDWFTIQAEDGSNGTKWNGKCWFIYEMEKYEFDMEFEIPVGYPTSPIEIQLPKLDGKTPKMYRGGKICLTVHFKPLWSKNVPHFGIAHALALGLAPWLAAEVPILVEAGVILKSGTDTIISEEKSELVAEDVSNE
jgi:ufm1-conjugating enzyme 1